LTCLYFEESCTCGLDGVATCLSQSFPPDMSPTNLPPADLAGHCANHLKDDNETDVDCGGPDCPACALGERCDLDRDCVGGGACARGVCTDASYCDDGRIDGDETDVDCGGPRCAPCPDGAHCVVRDDCRSDHCTHGRCFTGLFAPVAGPDAHPDSIQDFTSIVAADLDGDGHIDLGLGENGSGATRNVGVLLGLGGGTFAPIVHYPAGPSVISIAAGDLDRDGKVDLVVGNGWIDINTLAGGVSVLRGSGAGRFEAPVFYAAGQGTEQVVLGDFNGDGALDAVTCNYNSSDAGLLLNKGDGTFQSAMRIALPGNCAFLIAGDFDRDGLVDAAALAGDRFVQLLTGDRTAGLKAGAPLALGPLGLQSAGFTAGDFDGDGRLDLAVSVAAAGGTGVSVLLGDGQGGFGAPHLSDTAIQPGALAAGDLDGDCRLDLAVMRIDGTVVPMLGRGDGTFAPDIDYRTSGGALVVADVDGDHLPDVVTSGAPVTILRNTR
jgi:hypothetical protein